MTPSTMNAVVFTGKDQVRLERVPMARLIDPDDVLLRITRAAICGTDIGLIRRSEGLALGTTLGHEYVGIVEAIGTGVRVFRVGDRVAGSDFVACGRCWWCRRGDHWECPARAFFGTGTAFGPALPGAQAEYLRVPQGDVVLQLVPDAISDDAAVFFGDVLATGYAAVSRADLLPGDTVAIIGGGPVGQLTSLIAQARGAGPVIVVEPIAARRASATELGAIAVTPDDARSLIDQLTEGRGADAVIDAVGGAIGLDSSFALVRKRGTVVSVGIHHQDGWALPVQRAFSEELTLRFAIGDSMRDRDQFTALVSCGLIDPTPVLTRVAPFGEAIECYADLLEQRALKIVLTL